MKKIAIIDMGTNTFHLLIAGEGPSGHVIVHRDYEAVKLGKGGINEGIIANDARERALHAMIRFNDAIREARVSDVYAFGTSAMRNAKNGFTLVKEILTATGIDVRIISGDEEADRQQRRLLVDAVKTGEGQSSVAGTTSKEQEAEISKNYREKSSNIGRPAL